MNKWKCVSGVICLFTDSEKEYDSVEREVLYNILIGFGVPLKIVRLIKTCLNETYRLIMFLSKIV
jgi:hypothetical protein